MTSLFRQIDVSFVVFAAGVGPCAGRKTSPCTSS